MVPHDWIGDPIDVDGAVLRIRASQPGDRAYIATHWITSYEPAAGQRSLQGRLVDRLLDSRQTIAAVVCSEATPTALFGMAVATVEQVLHYAYVDKGLRRRGVARAAIAAVCGYPSRIECTHRWPHKSGRFAWNWYRAGAELALGV